jgi:hypothetical protein
VKLPALPLGTALVLVAFLASVSGLAGLLIYRGNATVEQAAVLAVAAILGTVGHFAQGLRGTGAGEAGKLPPEG